MNVMKSGFLLFVVDNTEWTWVVCKWQSTTQCRFVRVPNRTKRTLNAVIDRYVEEGSYMVTDFWGGYGDLNQLGYEHGTVNHNENYLNTVTKTHEQEIESAWNILKAPWKRVRGNHQHLQSHADQVNWRMFRKPVSPSESLFSKFMDDQNVIHRQQ